MYMEEFNKFSAAKKVASRNPCSCPLLEAENLKPNIFASPLSTFIVYKHGTPKLHNHRNTFLPSQTTHERTIQWFSFYVGRKGLLAI